MDLPPTVTRMERPQVAVIDLDGVLADARHRLHHLATRPKAWDDFFDAAPLDPPLPEGFEVLQRLGQVYDVVYLSGRPERCRADTETWLVRHEAPAGPVLLRPDRDRRPARLFKIEQLRRLARDVEVVVLVDDDPRVVAAAREAGFDVLPATWMPQEATQAASLQQAQEQEGRT